MWARAIDGIILVSEEFADQIKTLCTPGTKIETNGEVWMIGKNMDLERTGSDDRFWFYSEDESRALQVNFLRTEDSFEVSFVERKTYWFGAMQEKSVNLISLSFPEANTIIVKEKNERSPEEQ